MSCGLALSMISKLPAAFLPIKKVIGWFHEGIWISVLVYIFGLVVFYLVG